MKPLTTLGSEQSVSASAATLNNLLTQMYQDKEVLQGWDAVMNLLESAVNTFFQHQWAQHTGQAGYMSISQVWCDGVQPVPHGQGWFTNVTELEIRLAAPLFQFENGQNAVTVRQNILSGSLRTGTLEVPQNYNPSTCDCHKDDPRVDWGNPQTIDTSAGPWLAGTVQLEQVTGWVANADSLVLDFAKGAFTLNHLTVSHISNTTIVDQIKDWFASNSIHYILASVDMQDLSGSAALTPSSFRFNVVTTNAGNTIVQLLITTNGTPPSSTTINVNEPIPTADGLTCSLMISSRILYQNILVQGFNTPGHCFSLYAVPPSGAYGAWSATISPEMHFSGSFSYGSCCNRTTDTYSIYLGGDYTGTTTQGFLLSQHIHTGGNAPVDIDVSALNPVTLSGSGAGQTINITPQTPSVIVSGGQEEALKSRLQNILNDDFKSAMAGISFTPVTYFALRNLLFSGSLMQMSAAQVPADMLIAGTFQPA